LGGQQEREYRSAAVRTTEAFGTIEALVGVTGTAAIGNFCNQFGRPPNGSVDRGAARWARDVKVATVTTYVLKVIIYPCC